MRVRTIMLMTFVLSGSLVLASCAVSTAAAQPDQVDQMTQDRLKRTEDAIGNLGETIDGLRGSVTDKRFDELKIAISDVEDTFESKAKEQKDEMAAFRLEVVTALNIIAQRLLWLAGVIGVGGVTAGGVVGGQKVLKKKNG